MARHKMLITIIALLSLTNVAHAETWTKGEVAAETSWQLLNVIDWGQTRYAAKHPDLYYEKGIMAGGAAPLISTHPTTARVDEVMLLFAVAHYLISDKLDRGWQRTGWQGATLVLKANCVRRNMQMGLQVSF